MDRLTNRQVHGIDRWMCGQTGLLIARGENRVSDTDLGLDGIGGQQHRGFRRAVDLLFQDLILHLNGNRRVTKSDLECRTLLLLFGSTQKTTSTNYQ